MKHPRYNRVPAPKKPSVILGNKDFYFPPETERKKPRLVAYSDSDDESDQDNPYIPQTATMSDAGDHDDRPTRPFYPIDDAPSNIHHPPRLHQQDCPRCGKTFTDRKGVSKHIRRVHERKMHRCDRCRKNFTRKYNRDKHTRRCVDNFRRPNQISQDGTGVVVSDGANADIIQPVVGNDGMDGVVHTNAHTIEPVAGLNQSTNANAGDTEPDTMAGKTDETVRVNINTDDAERESDVDGMVRANWCAIKSHTVMGNVQDMYNIAIDDQPLEPQLMDILPTIKNTCKLNASYGYILQHTVSGELRFFHPCANNTRVLDEPMLVRNKDDFDRFVDEIVHTDILEWARQQRFDTKWVVVRVTSISVYVTNLRKHTIGAPITLPPHIVNNKAVISLAKNNRGVSYTDNLCLFRCIGLHYGKDPTNLERAATTYFHQYTDEDVVDFEGVDFSDLYKIEDIFELNIDVYSLEVEDDDPDTSFATLVRRSPLKHKETMFVNFYKNHFSFITDIKLYTKSFCCSHCGKLWEGAYFMRRHEQTCTAEIKHKFPAGTFHTKPTIFELLDDELIHVPEELRYFKFRATFDFESYFESDDGESTSKLEWVAKHIPLSVSIASNVPGYEEPVCFVTDGDSSELVGKMVTYLKVISAKSEEIVREQLRPYFDRIDEKIHDLKSENPQLAVDEEIEKLPLYRAKKILEGYVKQLPVIGFNSGKYDVNLVKAELLHHLSPDKCHVIKRTHNFLCLSTPNLKFLDMVNYLAPGYSYSSYLKAYECEESKGFFPYEYLQSLDQLDEDHLPPHVAFHSQLKNTNITDGEYAYCEQVWRENDMRTLKDFLIWYNNKDVTGFLEAIEKQFDFYMKLGLDMFKKAISAPGLTLDYLFKTLNDDQTFCLFGQSNKDLYYTLKKNVVGGPSLIFHRHHERGVTKLREVEYGPEAKTCETIEGYDANALYLWALMQPMPTGWYIRRKREDNFRPHKSHTHGYKAARWMDWESNRTGDKIRHMFNNSEKRIGIKQLPVDGFCRETQSAYEFLGCWYHMHDDTNCPLYKGQDEVNRFAGDDVTEVRANTEKKLKYIKDSGYNLVYIWECEWDRRVKENVHIKEFLKANERRTPNLKDEQKIIKGIVDQTWFGLVECDIEVPDELKEHFAELPPIFKNTEVSREDIGPTMRAYAEDNDILTRPRRMLISSFIGEKIMLITPLVRWYLAHGLVITKIHQIVEYQQDPCFVKFGDAVSNARRDGDKHPDKAIIANTMKLTGNCGVGKTITDKEKHTEVVYANDDNVDKYVNSKYFRKLNQLTADIYEVELAKHTIVFDLPFQIGYFVYGYAKLRMLEFLYDFVDKYVSREDYQLCETDTDSLYLALSGPNLEDVVVREKRAEFFRERDGFLMEESCQQHHDQYTTTKLNMEEWDMEAKTCCKDRHMYEMRTPGKFKLEWKGDCFLGLSSKTYFCSGPKDKISTKGLNKSQNEVTKQMFLDIIETKQSRAGVNRGFRVRSNKMYTYTQTKNALTYFYPKRIVLSDGVSTIPLNI